MKNKKVYLVYQDCTTCGSKGKDLLPQIESAIKANIEIVKKPFFHEDVEGLCAEALKHGIAQMPFFTDKEKFSYKLEDFVEKPVETEQFIAKATPEEAKALDKAVKKKTSKKGKKDGVDKEAE